MMRDHGSVAAAGAGTLLPKQGTRGGPRRPSPRKAMRKGLPFTGWSTDEGEGYEEDVSIGSDDLWNLCPWEELSLESCVLDIVEPLQARSGAAAVGKLDPVAPGKADPAKSAPAARKGTKRVAWADAPPTVAVAAKGKKRKASALQADPVAPVADAPPRRKAKVHTVCINSTRILHTFLARLPQCPYPNCGGLCELGTYRNRQPTKSPSGVEARCLLWAHRCHTCDSWHQVEEHGHPESYDKWRSNSENGDFFTPDELQAYVCKHGALVKESWFGHPQCNFGMLRG